MKTTELNDVNYLNNPFPHCVIDNFLDTDHANKLHEELNSLNLENADVKFKNINNLHEYNKFAFNKIEKLPLTLRNTFIYLNSKEFIAKIEKLTGIPDLIYGDVNLLGAGVHMIKNKGFLGMHTDFNIYNHPTYGKLDRRINLLIYMNKDWKSEYKGDLLMYHPDNISDVKRYQPIMNRCVIFNTTNKSIHGHPEGLCVPDDLYRKSLAVYYYTKNKNGNTDFEGYSVHNTLWHKTPN